MADRTISIIINEELLSRVDSLADKDGVSRSRIIRETLEMALHIRAKVGLPRIKPLPLPEE
jgi:metal-responsive CopG/Arc/MetJ family transcriptional regulator